MSGKDKTELFAENYRAVRSQWFTDRSPLPYLAAWLLTAEGAAPGSARLREAKLAAEAASPRFSGAAEETLPLLAARAALSAEPERLLDRIADSYTALRGVPLPHVAHHADPARHGRKGLRSHREQPVSRRREKNTPETEPSPG